MFPLDFRKERAEYFIQCLEGDKPIAPKKDWNVMEMITLAGVCFCAIRSHGLTLKQVARRIQSALPTAQVAGRQDATDNDAILNDIHAAIEFVSELAWLVHEKEYDRQWEQSVECLVYQEGQIRNRHIPLKGSKKGKNLLDT